MVAPGPADLVSTARGNQSPRTRTESRVGTPAKKMMHFARCFLGPSRALRCPRMLPWDPRTNAGCERMGDDEIPENTGGGEPA